jgi:hypothetical protein
MPSTIWACGCGCRSEWHHDFLNTVTRRARVRSIGAAGAGLAPADVLYEQSGERLGGGGDRCGSPGAAAGATAGRAWSDSTGWHPDGTHLETINLSVPARGEGVRAVPGAHSLRTESVPTHQPGRGGTRWARATWITAAGIGRLARVRVRRPGVGGRTGRGARRPGWRPRGP